jgi:hypothetical protein
MNIYTSIICFLVLQLSFNNLFGQSFRVNGNISTPSGNVNSASVIFVEKDNPNKKFTTNTDNSGNYHIDIITGIKDNNSYQPANFNLKQNYPNPFSASTNISYELNKNANVSVKIFNVIGQEVKTFFAGYQATGRYNITWDGRNNAGSKVPTGIYFYQLNSNNETIVKKMIFGFGESNAGNIIVSFPNNIVKKNLNPIPAMSNDYIVYIQNSENTSPRINYAQFNAVLGYHDTVLNYKVNKIEYSLCYTSLDSMKQPSGIYYTRWQIHVNNSLGTNPKNISSWAYDCTNPVWSPDGRYIAFNRDKPANNGLDRDIYIYDTFRDTLIPIAYSDSCDESIAIWTPDSQNLIYYARSYITATTGTYIINLQDKVSRPLKYPVVYLSSDRYNYYYLVTNSQYNLGVYHSNMDGTLNEFIVDLKTFVKSGGISIYDYDPYKNKFLLSLDDPSTALPNCIATYDINQGRFDTVAVSDTGGKYYRPIYSNWCDTIAFVDKRWTYDPTMKTTVGITLITNKTKTELFRFNSDSTSLDFNPFSFSTDGEYFAYVISPYLAWEFNLYVIELNSKQVTFIDSGYGPSWNPALPH